MTNLIKSLECQVVTLTNNVMQGNAGSRAHSKVTKSITSGFHKLDTINSKAVEKIWQLGGKFAIMYMLWISNVEAASKPRWTRVSYQPIVSSPTLSTGDRKKRLTSSRYLLKNIMPS